MGFTPGILKSIKELGFDSPMPVQEKVIPLMLDGERDIIALAQTGTGKTAAFGLPLVMKQIGITTHRALILMSPQGSSVCRLTEYLNTLRAYRTTKILPYTVERSARIQIQSPFEKEARS